MAAKAYVVSMTVTELKEELKQRGLSTRGSKKSLRDRLEQALYDEELDDPSSESDSEGTSQMFGQGLGGFNFEVPPESFIAEEDIVPDEDEDDPDYVEPMIVSVQLSDRDKLKVCPRASATPKMPVGIEGRSMGERSLGPMIVAIELGNRNLVAQQNQPVNSIVDGGRGEEDTRTRRATQVPIEPAAMINSAPLVEDSVKPDTAEVNTLRRRIADLATSQEASTAQVTIVAGGNNGEESRAVIADVSINGSRDAAVDDVAEQTAEQSNTVAAGDRQGQRERVSIQSFEQTEASPARGKDRDTSMDVTEERSVAPPTESMATEPQTISETSPLINTEISANANETDSGAHLPESEQQQEETSERDEVSPQIEPEAESTQLDEVGAASTASDSAAASAVIPDEVSSVSQQKEDFKQDLQEETSDQVPRPSITSERTSIPMLVSDVPKESEEPSVEEKEEPRMSEGKSEGEGESQSTAEHTLQPAVVQTEDENTSESTPLRGGEAGEEMEVETPPQGVEHDPQAQQEVTSSSETTQAQDLKDEVMDIENHPGETNQDGEPSLVMPQDDQEAMVCPESAPEEKQVAMEGEPATSIDMDEGISPPDEPVETSQVESNFLDLARPTPSRERSPSIEAHPPSEIRFEVESDSQLPRDANSDTCSEAKSEEEVSTGEGTTFVAPRPSQEAEDLVSPMSSSIASQERPEEIAEGEEEAPLVTSEQIVSHSVSSGSPQEGGASTGEEVPLISGDFRQEQVDEASSIVSSVPSRESGAAASGEDAPLVSVGSTLDEEPLQEGAATSSEDAPLVSVGSTLDEEKPLQEGAVASGEDSPLVSAQDEEVNYEHLQEGAAASGEDAPLISAGPTQDEELPPQEGTAASDGPIISPEPSQGEDTTVSGGNAPIISPDPSQGEDTTVSGEDAPIISPEPSQEEDTTVSGGDAPIISPGEDAPISSPEPSQGEDTTVSGEDAPIVTSEHSCGGKTAVTDGGDAPLVSAGLSQEEKEDIGSEYHQEEERAVGEEDPLVNTELAQEEVTSVQEDKVAPASSEGAPAISEDAPVVTMGLSHGESAEASEDVHLSAEASQDEQVSHRSPQEQAAAEGENPLITPESTHQGEDAEAMVDTTFTEDDKINPDLESLDNPLATPTSNPDKLVKQDEETSQTSGVGDGDSNGRVTTSSEPTGEGEGGGEGEVSRDRESVPLESGEVDVLLHAEEDDLSVFSAEAAEADKAFTSSSSHGTAHGSLRKHRQQQQTRLSASSSSLSGTNTGTGPSAQPSSSKTSLSNDESSSSVSASAESLETSGASCGTVGTSLGRRSSSSVDAEAASSGDKRQRTDKTEVSGDLPSIKRRRISAHASTTGATGKDGTTPTSGGSGSIHERKRRWGKQRSNSSSAANISSDVLKDIIPADVEALMNEDQMEVGVANTEEAGLTCEEEEPSHNGEGQSAEDIEWDQVEKEREQKKAEVERARQELETRRRIEARLKAKQEAEAKSKVMRRTPSPARNPPSRILHVNHLTRPFTKLQLNELLTEDGEIIKEAFWTNRIKSHCIAVYKSVDSAVATRARLHGLKWPSTNSKFLAVDYLTPEDVTRISEGQLEVKEVVGVDQAEDVAKTMKEETSEQAPQSPSAPSSKPHPPEVEDIQHQKQKRLHDQDKEEERPRKQEGPRPDKRRQSRDKMAKEEAEEEQLDYIEEEAVAPPPPAKEAKATMLLDELFRKTKATPCIYWLPLTDAQVEEREAEEKAREEEREKRRAERIRLRQEEREKEEKEREKRLEAIREQRAKERERERERERNRRRSRSSRSRSRSRSKSKSRSRSRSRDRRDRRRR